MFRDLPDSVICAGWRWIPDGAVTKHPIAPDLEQKRQSPVSDNCLRMRGIVSIYRASRRRVIVRIAIIHLLESESYASGLGIASTLSSILMVLREPREKLLPLLLRFDYDRTFFQTDSPSIIPLYLFHYFFITITRELMSFQYNRIGICTRINSRFEFGCISYEFQYYLYY